MKKITILALALTSAAFVAPTTAYADPGDHVGNGQGNQGCGLGNGGAVDPGNCGGNGGAGGNGGNGGNGGAGGTGIGVGVGVGIAGAEANASAAANAIAAQQQGQQQGQLQGQMQGQIATGGAATIGDTTTTSNATGGSVTGSGNSTNDNKSSAVANNDSHNASASQGNTTTVTGDTVTYEARRIPVATAWAAPLTSGNDVCMGSVSAGAQGAIIGLSFAKTYTDEHCVNMKLARELKNQGFGIESCELLIATEPRVAEAFRRSGRTCATATIAVPVEAGMVIPTPKPETQPVIQPVNPPFQPERG